MTEESNKTIIDSLKEQSEEAKAEAIDEEEVDPEAARQEKEEEHIEQMATRNQETEDTYVADFDSLIESDALIPVPDELTDQLLNSVNKVKNAGAFSATDTNGRNRVRFPKQDIYSGVVFEVSNNPIKFPDRTGYGTDNYVRVYLEDEDLSIYVPARQAGLTQPRALTQMRFHRCSVVVTDLYAGSLEKENGNQPAMYAIGSIQMAEYQIGAQLRSEMVNDPKNFETYNRTGEITHIDRRHQTAVISMDLRGEGKGFIDVEVPFDDLMLHYRFQRITDVKSLREGKNIVLHFNGVYERQMEDKTKNIRGTYFDIKATRKTVHGFYSKANSALASAVNGGQLTGYIYGRTAQNGILVEICPGMPLRSTSSYRHVSRDLQITNDDIKNHAEVSFTFVKRATGVEGAKLFLEKKIKRPVIINSVKHVNTHRGMQTNLGTYKGVSQQQVENVNERLSLENSKSNPTRKAVANAAEQLMKKINDLTKKEG